MPIILAYFPEIALFLLTILMSTQMWEIGALLAAAIVGVSGLLILWRPVAAAETLLRWSPLLLVGILAVASVLWSDQQMASFRYGAQLLFTMFVGAHLGRLLNPERFVALMMAALFVFCALSIASGRQGPSAEGMVLVGLTGSKNQMGYAACYLLMSAVATLLLPKILVQVRWLALLSVPMAAFLLFEARALMALLMAFAGCIMIFCLWIAQRLPPGGRVGLVLAALLVASPFALALPEIQQGVEYVLFDVFQKDPTLTGRTILWERADALIAQRPIFGWGYQAIWMGDSSETIGLQRLSGQADGRSFHFHNQFRQVGVDLGWVGLIAFAGAMLATAAAAFRQAILAPHPATSFFAVVFFITMARAYSDQVLSPFSFATALLFAACVYIFRGTVLYAPAGHPPEMHDPLLVRRMRATQRGFR